jgi:hypothetical protein
MSRRKADTLREPPPPWRIGSLHTFGFSYVLYLCKQTYPPTTEVTSCTYLKSSSPGS